MTTLVSGARGTIARCLAEALRQGGNEVRSVITEPPEMPGIPLLSPHDSEAWRRALDGVTRVFLYSDPRAVEAFVAPAEAAGIGHVALLSSIAAASGEAGGDLTAPFVACETSLASSRIPWTFVRPAAFATNARWWAPGIRRRRVANVWLPDAHTAPLHERDIADVLATVLTTSGHDGAVYALTGPESLSQRRQVELIGQALGEPVRVHELAEHEARAEFPWLPDEFFTGLAAQSDRPVALMPTTRQIIDRAPRHFAQWSVEHAHEFR